jgi:hypothetical protein
MPLIHDKAGNIYSFETLQDHGDSISLDNTIFLSGKLSDFTVVNQEYLTRMTVLAYRNRFTTAEKVAIEMAALDDPAADMAARTQAAAVRVYVQDLATAKYIDPSDEATRAGTLALEAAGLLAEGRALAILDAPIEAKERL